MFEELSLWPHAEPVSGGFAGRISMGHSAYTEAIVLWQGETVESRLEAYRQASVRMVDKLKMIFEDWMPKPSEFYTNDYTVARMKEAREQGWDENAPSLSFDEICELEEGAILWILWSGGNGPYKCWLIFDPRHFPHIVPCSEPSPINTPLRFYNPLSFIGSEPPFTVLWRAN